MTKTFLKIRNELRAIELQLDSVLKSWITHKTSTLETRLRDVMRVKLVKVSPKLLGTSLSRVPNAEGYQVGDKVLHPMFVTLFGLEKGRREEPTVVRGENGAMNKYMAYQIRRLRRLRSNPDKFWYVVEQLQKRSWSFRIAALNHVLPDWHTDMTYTKVHELMSEVKDLMESGSTELQYRRVYIPKSNGKWRPLGVPSKAWRITLHIMNGFLGIYLEGKLLPSQHGFIPGRGCGSAWRAVITRATKAKFIYECDLSNCFNAIKLSYLYNCLLKLGIPKRVADWIIAVNKEAPQLPKVKLLDESYFERIKELKIAYLAAISKPENHREASDHQAISAWENLNNFTGVAQGSPMSPLLSNVALMDFLLQGRESGVSSISYADDPIFYSETDFEIKDNPENGIILNREKSGWIRRDGEWKSQLKYLGLKYNWEDQSLEGATRNGSTWKLDRTILKKLSLIILGERLIEGRSIWLESDLERVVKSRYWGLALSWLYNNGTKAKPGNRKIVREAKWSYKELTRFFWINAGWARNNARALSSLAIKALKARYK